MPALPELSPEDVSAVTDSSVGNRNRRSSARLAAAKISSTFETKKRTTTSKCPEKTEKKKPRILKSCTMASAEMAVDDSSPVDVDEGNGNISNAESSSSPEPAPALAPVAADGENGNAHALVTATLRTFNKHYLHFIQVRR